MTLMKTGARFGAAAFAVGLSLAGPQAAGVAAADGGDDSPAVSAGSAGADGPAVSKTSTSGRGAARLAPRPPRAAATVSDAGPETAVQGPRRTGPAKAAAAQRSTPSVPVVDSSPANRKALAPAAVESGAAPESLAIPDTPAPRPAAAIARVVPPAPSAPAAASGPAAALVVAGPAAALCGSCLTPAPAPAAAIATAAVRLAQVLDGLGDRLANLPISPVTDLLSGALHLLRRTLLPNVPVIPKFSVTNASVLEGDTGTTDAVFTVQLARSYNTPVTVGYATVDPAETPDGVDSATAGEDYASASGLLTFAPGQTSQQVVVAVLGDTVVENPEVFDLDFYAVANAAPTNVVLAVATGTIADGDNLPDGVPTVLGQFMIRDWGSNPTYYVLPPAPIGICFGGGSNVGANTAAGCNGPADGGPGFLLQQTNDRTQPSGDKYYDWGGGDGVASQWWNTASVDELDNYMPKLTGAYQGIFYDLETFDPTNFDVNTMYSKLDESFQKAKDLGFKIIVSTSYTAPYKPEKGPGFAKTDALWRMILANPKIDYYSPQFYGRGQSAQIVKTSGSSVDFSDWTTLIPGGGQGKIVPILKAWSSDYLANQVQQMTNACGSIGQAFCSGGYLLWAST